MKRISNLRFGLFSLVGPANLIVLTMLKTSNVRISIRIRIRKVESGRL